MQIDIDKIRDVIGPGGKMINEIIAKSDNVKIDITQDGKVVIYHTNQEAINRAYRMIEEIVKVAKVGEIYEGKVTRIENFGAFIEIFNGCEGLLHVSKIANERVNNPKDVLSIGDIVKVIVTDIDDRGRVNLSRKELLPKPQKVENKEDKDQRNSKKRFNLLFLLFI